VKTVSTKCWRDYAYRIGICTSDEADSKSKAFRRGAEQLIAANRVGYLGRAGMAALNPDKPDKSDKRSDCPEGHVYPDRTDKTLKGCPPCPACPSPSALSVSGEERMKGGNA